MRTSFLFPLLVPLLVGCSSGPYNVARVSGRVTLNGQPLAHAAVSFQPIVSDGKINPGPGSGGFTDADGRYLLKLVGSETKGAIVGKHKVRITLRHEEDPADDRPKRSKQKQLPPRYNSMTELEYDVPSGGTDSADFKLTSP